MGLFNNLFKDGSNGNTGVQEAPVVEVESVPVEAKPGAVLNLTKGNVLDLSKQAPSLNKARVAAGWDMAKFGANYDLDLCAFLLNKDGKLTKSCKSLVYFGGKKSKGIYLDGDNLTGEGDGDDENIYVDFSKIDPDVERIVFAVVIYMPGMSKSFSGVKNAFVRLVDTANRDKEICRYNLTEDGGNNTAVIFAELFKDGSSWNFKAVGEYCRKSIRELEKMYM